MLSGLIRLVFFPVGFFPRRFELFAGKVIGLFLYYVVRLRREIVRRNLLTAFKNEGIDDGELKKIERENYIHYGRLCMEMLHLPFDAKNFSEKRVRVHNVEYLENAVKKGRGVFMLTAHVGYWEIMSVVATIYKFPLNVITKYLRIKIFDDIWVRSRERYGIRLIDECFTAKHVLKAVKNAEVVGFVLDQFMGPPVGVKVDFFGKPAWTIASLAWFVQKTGAAVVPVVNYRDDNGNFDLVIREDVGFEDLGNVQKNIVHNTQRYSKIVEGFIRQCPQQWLWLHRRWKTTREDMGTDL